MRRKKLERVHRGVQEDAQLLKRARRLTSAPSLAGAGDRGRPPSSCGGRRDLSPREKASARSARRRARTAPKDTSE